MRAPWIVGMPGPGCDSGDRLSAIGARELAHASSIHLVFPPGTTPTQENLNRLGLVGRSSSAPPIALACLDPTPDQIAALGDVGRWHSHGRFPTRVDLIVYGPPEIHDRVLGQKGHFSQIESALQQFGSYESVNPMVVFPLRKDNLDTAFELWWWLGRKRVAYQVTLDWTSLDVEAISYPVLELLENLAHAPSLTLDDRLAYKKSLTELLASRQVQEEVRLAGDRALAKSALEKGVVALPPETASWRQRLAQALRRAKVGQVRTIVGGGLGASRYAALQRLVDRRDKGARSSPSSPKALVIGWYGTETAGDKAILGGIWLELVKANPDVELVVASSLPFYTRQTLGELRLGRSHVIALDAPAIARGIGAFDLVLVGGGPLMDLAEMYQLLHIAAAARRESVPFAISGCGIGPARWPITRWAIRGLLECAGAVVLRDRDSLRRLEKWGIPANVVDVGLDPAINYLASLDVARSDDDERPRPVLGMGIRDWQWKFGRGLGRARFESTKVDLVRKYAGVCDRFVDVHGGDVRLVPMNTLHVGGDDRWLMAEVRECCQRSDRVHVLSGTYSARQIAAHIAACDVFLSMRYHSMLFATTLGVPTVALDYTLGGKIQGYGRDTGLVKDVIDLASHWRPEDVVERLNASLGERGRYRETLAACRADLIARSAKAGRVAARCMAGSKQDRMV